MSTTAVSLVDIAIDSGDEDIMQRLLLALGDMELDGSLSQDERDAASAEADRLAAHMRAKR